MATVAKYITKKQIFYQMLLSNDAEGNNCLQIAIKNNKYQHFEYIINELKEDDDKRWTLYSNKNLVGYTTLHMLACCELIIFQSIWKMIKNSLQRAAFNDLLLFNDVEENNCFQIAITKNKDTIVKFISEDLKDDFVRLPLIAHKNKEGYNSVTLCNKVQSEKCDAEIFAALTEDEISQILEY